MERLYDASDGFSSIFPGKRNLLFRLARAADDVTRLESPPDVNNCHYGEFEDDSLLKALSLLSKCLGTDLIEMAASQPASSAQFRLRTMAALIM
jgi:hypothetical protein